MYRRAVVSLTITVLSYYVWIAFHFVSPGEFDAVQWERLQPFRIDDSGGHAAAGAGVVTARFFGTSTLLFSDGTTSVMTDGFFTRATGGHSGLLWMALYFVCPWLEIKPNATAIDEVLARIDRVEQGAPLVGSLVGSGASTAAAGSSRLAAVAVVHSHHDHSMSHRCE